MNQCGCGSRCIRRGDVTFHCISRVGQFLKGRDCRENALRGESPAEIGVRGPFCHYENGQMLIGITYACQVWLRKEVLDGETAEDVLRGATR